VIRVVKVNGLRTPGQRAAVCYVGRAFAGWPASPWGNPFRPRPGFDAVAAFRDYAAALADLGDWLADLWEACGRGAKPLGCWCCDWDGVSPAEPVCHAVVLAQLLRERFDAPDRLTPEAYR
jgi:hypothetical protein